MDWPVEPYINKSIPEKEGYISFKKDELKDYMTLEFVNETKGLKIGMSSFGTFLSYGAIPGRLIGENCITGKISDFKLFFRMFKESSTKRVGGKKMSDRQRREYICKEMYADEINKFEDYANKKNIELSASSEALTFDDEIDLENMSL